VGAKGWVLALGHVGVFAGLLEGAGLEAEALEALRERVEGKDAAGARELLSSARLGAPASEAVARLSELAGDTSVLEEAARAFAFSPPARAAVAELAEVVSALRAAGLGERLAVDLGEVRGLDYYTGLVFRAYAPGLGFEVGGGGRYDRLLERFGRPLPAVGFMLGLDRLALLLERQGSLPAPAPAPAQAVAAEELGSALARARRLREAGTRVRFGDGGAR
jgi:ATP phosphoribosyltransferase regulatory subunit